MAEALGDDLWMDPLLQHKRSVSMPLIVKPNHVSSDGTKLAR